MNRPTGVTIVAILDFIGAAFLGLGAIALMLGGGIAGAMGGQRLGLTPAVAGMLVSMGIALGIFILIVAALVGFCGYGLWILKPWARMLTIILSAIGMLGGVLLLLSSAFHLNAGAIITAVFRLAINAVIIWYFMQPDVKRAFGVA